LAIDIPGANPVGRRPGNRSSFSKTNCSTQNHARSPDKIGTQDKDFHILITSMRGPDTRNVYSDGLPGGGKEEEEDPGNAKAVPRPWSAQDYPQVSQAEREGHYAQRTSSISRLTGWERPRYITDTNKGAGRAITGCTHSLPCLGRILRRPEVWRHHSARVGTWRFIQI